MARVAAAPGRPQPPAAARGGAAFPARLAPGVKPSAESHARAASVGCTHVAPAAVWSSTT
eukprot:6216839-Prymnesium_polylepis.1